MRRSLLTIAAACMWFAGTNVMAMGAPVEVAAAAEEMIVQIRLL